MNKELEEAAQEYKDRAGDIPSTELEQEISKLGFINGAEWQAERTYTKEQLREAMEYGYDAGYQKGFTDAFQDDPIYGEDLFNEDKSIFEDWFKEEKTK